MKEISDIISNEIAWVQPDWRKYEFEIRAGEDLIGSLAWEKIFGSLAIARSAAGVWTFQRGGFQQQWIAIRAEGQDWDIARFRLNWNGSSGLLTLHDGRQLRWGISNLEWRWEWDETTPVISIKADPQQEKIEGSIQIHPQAKWAIAPSLLALLGCYIIVLRWDEMSAALAS
jgi:hypothetical protein